MGERKQRWRNTKIITFLPNRPFPHSTAVRKHKKNEVEAWGGGGGTISYKSLYFVHPCHDLMPLFTGMRERPTHNCITAVKWDAYAVENTAGNARRCNPGRQILLTLLTWQHQQKNFYQFFYCDLWKASLSTLTTKVTVSPKVTTSRKHCKQFIEDITQWREDMNFIFESQNNILRTSAASE